MDRSGTVDRHACRSQVAGVLTPIAAHQVERCKTQIGLFLAPRQVHTHEADRFPVTDRTDPLYAGAIATQRDLELIPLHLHLVTVTQRHIALFDLRDVLSSHLHHVRTQDDLVLVVFLVFVERVIEVDILHIRRHRGRRSVCLRLLFRRGRVAFGTVEMFVAVEHRHLLFVKIRTPVVMEVITGGVIDRRERIVRPAVQHRRVHFRAQRLYVVLVRLPVLLLLRTQTVESHILLNACTALVAEGYHRTRRTRHITPYRAVHTTSVGVRHRQTVLERFLAVP